MKRLSPFRLWLYRIVAARLPETRAFGLKARLLRWCGAEVGRNVRINSSAVVSGTARLRIGDNVWIGGGAIILPGVTIGNKDNNKSEVEERGIHHEFEKSSSHCHYREQL